MCIRDRARPWSGSFEVEVRSSRTKLELVSLTSFEKFVLMIPFSRRLSWMLTRWCSVVSLLGIGLYCSAVPAQEATDAASTDRDVLTSRPNIVMINLDDADLDIFTDEILEQYLPNIKQLATGGWRFTNCHATTPLCGPSRVCLLRGQHAHKTGTKTNQPDTWLNNGFTGGYSIFKQRGYEKEHLGIWMQRAGYRTMVVGKYIHGRYRADLVSGWDDLYLCFGGQYYGTSRYNSRLEDKRLRRRSNEDNVYPVSYTHLTLPTICSV